LVGESTLDIAKRLGVDMVKTVGNDSLLIISNQVKVEEIGDELFQQQCQALLLVLKDFRKKKVCLLF
jgi:hypothetical protein